MTRTMIGLAGMLMLGGCSIDGRSMPGALAVQDPTRPHLNISTSTRTIGFRREF